MKIVIAPDSFKGSLSASEAATAIEEGVRRVFEGAEILKVPMADGGEGTVRSLVEATGGKLLKERVQDPLGRPIIAEYGILGDGETAVIEMAAASGLPLLTAEERNPLITTTLGTGQLIKAALDRGCRKLIIGIGGSATVDGGAGMAKALGARLFDQDEQSIGPGGGALARLQRIDMASFDARIAKTEVVVASDVDNPLVGPRGAAHVYGPQKGATAEMVEVLDENLAHFAEVIRRDLGKDVKELPGAGAAGGLGAGLVALLNAKLRLGVEIVIQASELEQKMQGSDFVITGEGAIDEQSIYGKTVMGVVETARKAGIPVIAIAGSLGEGAHLLFGHGLDALMSTIASPMSLEEAMQAGGGTLADAAERACRFILLGSKINAERWS